jgi:hypothetical protein
MSIQNKRIIYYYQTFTGLNSILHQYPETTHIHLSSIHFGNNSDGTPYIHLNDNDPEDKVFDPVWIDIKNANNLGIQIILMIGGAGGGFSALFDNFEIYYDLLKNTLQNHPEITGIDLDIEEDVLLTNVRMLIKRLKTDFPQFIIAMAPLPSSLSSDQPGMGGFSYKDLYTSPEGQYIDYFNGQFYGSFMPQDYIDCITNGYPENKVVMGMIFDQDFDQVCQTLMILSEKYKQIGGSFVWEYFQSPPSGQNDPGKWAKIMNTIFNGVKFNDVKFNDVITQETA